MEFGIWAGAVLVGPTQPGRAVRGGPYLRAARNMSAWRRIPLPARSSPACSNTHTLAPDSPTRHHLVLKFGAPTVCPDLLQPRILPRLHARRILNLLGLILDDRGLALCPEIAEILSFILTVAHLDQISIMPWAHSYTTCTGWRDTKRTGARARTPSHNGTLSQWHLWSLPRAAANSATDLPPR